MDHGMAYGSRYGAIVGIGNASLLVSKVGEDHEFHVKSSLAN